MMLNIYNVFITISILAFTNEFIYYKTILVLKHQKNTEFRKKKKINEILLYYGNINLII